uniref:Uncharacterized protein n=1 Tax=Rhizophora mucronata TaxID=61149 RepID=A0A2P2PZN4_RHIMU
MHRSEDLDRLLLLRKLLLQALVRYEISTIISVPDSVIVWLSMHRGPFLAPV